MKYKLLSLLSILMMLLGSWNVNAQYYITARSRINVMDSSTYCSPNYAYITTNAYSSSLSIEAYYENGTSVTYPVNNGGSYGYANCYPGYSFPGTYTEKYVLLNGTTPVDSIILSYEYLYCSTAILKIVNDIPGTGIYDSSLDSYIINEPIQIQVAHNGVPVDTIYATSGDYYQMIGATGDIFAFKILSGIIGATLSFPTGGIIYDTIKTISNNYVPQYFGFKCTGSTSSFDLSVTDVIPVTGEHDEWGNVYVSNNSCDAVNATVTVHYSKLYDVEWSGGSLDVRPTPASYTDSTITWNVTGLSSLTGRVDLYYAIWTDLVGPLITPGMVVKTYVTVTPTVGDIDTLNNNCEIIDTVKAGCDPNEMSVNPPGCLSDGVSNLQYTIAFMNVGNDTAFNIHVMDTLSNNVDLKSLKIAMASNTMDISELNDGTNNIVKFDFPNINLLDSTACPQCSGAVVFNINTLPGLPTGTTIFNRAGVYFDYNPVVMTNTVENITGCLAQVNQIKTGPALEIFPNPTADDLTIKMNAGAYNTMTITNTIGQILITQQINAPQTEVNVSRFPIGIYYVMLRGNNGVNVQKFEKL